MDPLVITVILNFKNPTAKSMSYQQYPQTYQYSQQLQTPLHTRSVQQHPQQSVVYTTQDPKSATVVQQQPSAPESPAPPTVETQRLGVQGDRREFSTLKSDSKIADAGVESAQKQDERLNLVHSSKRSNIV
jgi:hypothetical protein